MTSIPLRSVNRSVGLFAMAASSAACPIATLGDAAITQRRICWSERSHNSTRNGNRIGMSCRFGFARSRSNLSTRMRRGYNRQNGAGVLLIRGFAVNCFLLKDRCALPDQISLIPSFRQRTLGLAVRDGDRANKIEIVIFVSRVATNDCPHDVLPMV